MPPLGGETVTSVDTWLDAVPIRASMKFVWSLESSETAR